MNPPVYRITGTYRYGLRGAVNRVTVRRRNGDLAYYETLEHAKRGLAGLRGNSRAYDNLLIEQCTGDFRPVG